jgi:hypothetical protein
MKDKKDSKEVTVKVDPDGLTNRILELPDRSIQLFFRYFCGR